jgi:uncharacterized membrane protein YsdA (DUF1294 family)
MPYYIYCFYYLIIINFISILVTVCDKYKAIKHQWRIPESTLLLIAALGGSPAMLITMALIHHKTKHKKFMIGIPIIIILQLIACYFLLSNLLIK